MNNHFAKRFHHQAIANWRLPKTRDAKNPIPREDILFKTYPRSENTALAEPLPLSHTLEKTLSERKTTRSFDPVSAVSFQELSSLLFWSAGLRENRTDPQQSKRFYPSAGERYPLEIYIAARNVDGLPKGLYHFNLLKNSLEKIGGEEYCDNFQKNLGYEWSRDTAVAILITGVWERTFSKYGDFGYRLICTEAGHVAQNLQLIAQSLGLDYASIAGFKEKEMDTLLNLDSDKESSLYLTLIGKATPSTRTNA
ncbi:SagB/ThcOx family dehydrogenase [Candidatus Parcubacteria bacterium]|nr:SagB/ThcOx family dehydrogenase [Candidatus Parcubacteria bacterium]